MNLNSQEEDIIKKMKIIPHKGKILIKNKSSKSIVLLKRKKIIKKTKVMMRMKMKINKKIVIRR